MKSRSRFLRFGLALVLGMGLVLAIEDDFESLAQLAQLNAVDVVFLLLWGALFGGVLYALAVTLRRALRFVVPNR